jgi:hypothetical protein
MLSKTSDQPIAEEVPSSPLNADELRRITSLLVEIRSSVGQLPSKIGAELISLLATAEGHLSAEPPNAVATHEALLLIRDEIVTTNSPQAEHLVAQLDLVLRMLGEPQTPRK